MKLKALAFILATLTCGIVFAASGDPQIKTDHPWYPGELSCSTFERLFKTQAEVYTRVTGRNVDNDEDKALAAWYWRNLHYAHGEEGACDTWSKGFNKGGDSRNREYWAGLFGYGFGLCGTTHAQFTVEINNLLGLGRARTAGVSGHNSFEAYLTGGAYGSGKWVLLDHDVSTVIFHPDGSRLLSIFEIMADLKTLKNPNFKPERQRGWRVAGLADEDCAVFNAYNTAEYCPGYAGPAPTVHLRAGETLRRYLYPGLEDGKTFVYWGMNYNAKDIPGPERSRTWVNQPDKMYGSKKGTGWNQGQARFANAVYTYTPNFKNGSYKEGVIEESDKQVTFEFYSPYIIASTPSGNGKWAVYDSGGRNGLVLKGKMTCPVQVSVNQGKSWSEPVNAQEGLDLTDHVKGSQQYWIRFNAAAGSLADSGLTIRTVCQCNVAIIPRLHDGDNKVTFLASGNGLVSAGPIKEQAEAHVVEGAIGSKEVTLELKSPRGEKISHLYAASWQSSGAPPGNTKFQIEYSLDQGKTWNSVVKDWQIIRHDPEPKDFWSQSMSWGDVELKDVAGPVRVRFKNDGGKQYLKVEAHLAYQVQNPGATEVTFGWKESAGELKTASHLFEAAPGKEDMSWTLKTGQNTETQWVEYKAK